MKRSPDRRWRAALLAAVLALLPLGGAGGAWVHYLAASRQQVGDRLAQNFALRIAQRANETVSPVYMLAALVKQNRGGIPDFDKVAPELLQEFPFARALELAPAGVVQQVYPRQGNESIIGHDLLKDRGRNREAFVALARRQVMLAGPFELIQGGLGAVARYPVFLPNAQGGSTFWGFAIVLMHVRELLASSGEMDLERKGYVYRICRVMPDIEESGCRDFAGTAAGELRAPVSATIDLPNNQWRLSVAPAAGWISRGEWLAVALFMLVGALLAGGLRWLTWRRQDALTHDRDASGTP